MGDRQGLIQHMYFADFKASGSANTITDARFEYGDYIVDVTDLTSGCALTISKYALSKVSATATGTITASTEKTNNKSVLVTWVDRDGDINSSLG